jgi:putative MATE family efflux protein
MRRGSFALDDNVPVWRSMVVFLIPLMLSNILQSAAQTFTSIYLGRMIGVGALAAASAIFPLVFFLVSFFIGVSTGSTVLIGQAYGAKDHERIGRTAGTTLMFALLLSAVVGVGGFLAIRPLLHLLGTPTDIFENTAAYGRIIFATLPLFFVYLAYTTFLRGIGDSRTPFIVLIGTTLIGIILTPALITGWIGLPHLGVLAAPTSNVVATAVGIVTLLVWLERAHSPLALSAISHHLRIDWPTLKVLIRIGIPTGIQLVMVSLSEIAVLAFVNGFGSEATAAYGAVNQIVSYVQFPAISIGIAASIFGAQSIGAQRHDRLAKIVRSAVSLNYIVGGILIVGCYAFAEQILALFVTRPSTLAIAHSLLAITIWSYVIFGNASVLSGLMRSSGSVLYPTSISVAAIWLVEVPIAWFLSRTSLGLSGIWYAYPIAFIVGLSGMCAYYFFVWKRKPISELVGHRTTTARPS